MIRRLAATGGDLFIRTSAMRGGLTVTVAAAARIGTTDLAAHQIAFEMWTVSALALDAVAIAGQALTGQALGAGRVERARVLGRRMIGWGLLSGVLMCVGVLVVSPVLARVFTHDTAVAALTGFLLVHVALSQPAAGVVFALDGVLIGAGDLRFLGVAMACASVVLIGGGLIVLAVDAGIGWLWAVLHIWMASRLVLMLLRFASSAWQVTGPRAEKPASPRSAEGNSMAAVSTFVDSDFHQTRRGSERRSGTKTFPLKTGHHEPESRSELEHLRPIECYSLLSDQRTAAIVSPMPV